MKKTFINLFLLFFTMFSYGQGEPSSCTGSDSILKLYRKDADRLALRHIFSANTTYTDSVRINKSLSDKYLGALMAVYNATSIPARDTVVSLLSIHTAPSPEMNSLSIKAQGTLYWMVNLKNNTLPCNHINIDDMISRYALKIGTYYQSTLYDLVIFTSDSNWNMKAMANDFKMINGVDDADESVVFNDVKNITDSVNTAFTELTYSYGWDSCPSGCNKRRYWTFRVYNDCSVDYLGASGLPLWTNISNHQKDIVKVAPNPVNDVLNIEFEVSARRQLSLLNILGEEILNAVITEKELNIRLEFVPPGLYFLRINSGESAQSVRIIKQ